jgi:hypothetical protein
MHSRADKWLAKADDLIALFLSNAVFVINYFIKSSIGVLIYEHHHFTQFFISKIFDKGKGSGKGEKFQKRVHGRVGQAFLSLCFLFWKW